LDQTVTGLRYAPTGALGQRSYVIQRFDQFGHDFLSMVDRGSIKLSSKSRPAQRPAAD